MILGAPTHGAASQDPQHQMHGIPLRFYLPRRKEVLVLRANSMDVPLLGEVQDPRQLEVNPLTHPMPGVQILDRLQHLAHYRHNICQWSQIVLEVQRQDQEAHNFLGLQTIPRRI